MVRITTEKDMQLSYESATLITQQTGGKLTADDVMNLCEYGTTNAQDMSPESTMFHLNTTTCMCGRVDCPDEYEHTTSGC